MKVPTLSTPRDASRHQHCLATLLRRPAIGYRRRLYLSGHVRFLSFDPIARRTPRQGWKLHLSATVPAYTELLRRTIPLLRAERAAFKVAADLPSAMHINSGRGGLSQVGKLITVYPRDRIHAQRLAQALTSVTVGLPAPDVPGDFRFCKVGCVFLRYGAFASRWTSDVDGLPQPALRGPDGELRADVRTLQPAKPRGVRPLLRADRQERNASVARGRYYLFGEIARNHKGAVFAGLDLRTREGCVVKRAFANAHPYGDRITAVSLARSERNALGAIADLSVAPRLLDYWETRDQAFLVLEMVNGLDIQSKMKANAAETGLGGLPFECISQIASSISVAIDSVHKRGWVHRDIKPGNIILGSDEPARIFLIDWETAAREGSHRLSASTRGYRSTIDTRAVASRSEDWQAFGRVLIFLCTGFDLSKLPDEDIDPRLVLALHRRDCPKWLSARIDACLAGGQWSDTNPVQHALRPSLSLGGRKQIARAREALFATLVAQAEFSAPDRCTWRSGQPYAFGQPTPYINIGSAGVVLYLARRLTRISDLRTRRLLVAGLRGLKGQANAPTALRPGLMMGADGVNLAARAAAEVTGEPWTLVRSKMPDCLDFFDGLAGSLYAKSALQISSTATAKRLIAAVQDSNVEVEALASDRCEGRLGYAHGVAGIAAALALHAARTGMSQAQELAFQLGNQLLDHSRSIPGRPAQNVWPAALGDLSVSHGWCHGTVGFGKAFLGLHKATGDHRFRSAAEAAGQTLIEHCGSLDSTLCHGLAGVIDFMLDLATTTSDPRERERWTAEASAVADCLLLRSAVRGGHLIFVSESPEIVTCDYMVGMAGVAAALERLAAPNLPSCLPAL